MTHHIVLVTYTPFLIVSLFLSFFVYLRNRKNIVNQIFSSIIFCVAFWIFSLVVADASTTEKFALIGSRMAILGPSWFPALFLWFSQIFPQTNPRLTRFKICSYFLFPLMFTFLSPTSLNVKSVIVRNWGADLTTGILYPILFLYYLIFMGMAFLNLRKSFITVKTPREKMQILYVFWGAFLMVFFGLITNLLLPVLRISILSIFAPATTFFFIGSTFYAIFSHQLFNLRVIVAETVSVGIGLLLVIEALVSKTVTEGLLRGAVLIPYIYLASLLVRNVKSEIAQRERAEALAAELKKARDELAVAYEKLKELDKMKDEFISIASHELNTPLAAIQGYLSMIVDEKLAKVDKQAEEWLRHTYDSAKRLAALVRDLLDVSRIEQGRMKLEKKELDICLEIEAVMAEFQSMAKEKGLELVFEGVSPRKKKGICPKVLADSMRIREVLANLISNAIKYTKKGKVVISVNLQPTTNNKQQEVIVTVADTGIGMSQEQMEHLFTKFYRVESYETKQTPGTGLGLYIVKNIVELHGVMRPSMFCYI